MAFDIDYDGKCAECLYFKRVSEYLGECQHHQKHDYLKTVAAFDCCPYYTCSNETCQGCGCNTECGECEVTYTTLLS